MTWEYVALEEVDATNALLLVGVPAGRVAGCVASCLLAEHFRMRVVGGWQSETMPPTGVVRGGLMTSMLQVWSAEMACGLDGRCARLLVVSSDVPLPREQVMPFAAALARWGLQRHLHLVVTLEGNPLETPPAHDLEVRVASSLLGLPVAHRFGLPLLERGRLTSLSAALLMRANSERIPAVGLFASLPPEGGEARAAAALIAVLAMLVPNLPLDLTDLARRAEAAEASLRRNQRAHSDSLRRLQESIDWSYA